MAHPRPYPQNLNERSTRTAEPPNGAGSARTEISSETIADSAVAVAEYENTMSADRLIDRLKAQEQLAAALNEEADKCTSRAAYLVDSGCAALPKTVDDPVLREREFSQDILRYRQAPMRRLDYRPFSGERTVCPRCWIMDGRRCTGPIDPSGKFYACLGCGPT